MTNSDSGVDDVDQDSEPTNTAPPGERPSDPGPIEEAAAENDVSDPGRPGAE